jgi:hypothetical protein
MHHASHASCVLSHCFENVSVHAGYIFSLCAWCRHGVGHEGLVQVGRVCVMQEVGRLWKNSVRSERYVFFITATVGPTGTGIYVRRRDDRDDHSMAQQAKQKGPTTSKNKLSE